MKKVVRYEGPDGLLARGPYATPREFFEEIVSPNVDSFLADQGSKQFAFNAAVALYHMTEYVCGFAAEHNVDWFPDAGDAGIEPYRQRLLEKCPQFGVAEAVALAYKHYKLRHARAKEMAPAITSILRSVEIMESNALDEHKGATWAMDFTKPYKATERIIVQSADGTTHDLAEILVAVRDMWRAELDEIAMEGRTPHELKAPTS